MKEQDAQAKLSLKLQAYQYLKTKILNCEYRPNEFLNEQKLCAEMGNISRTPMRDNTSRLCRPYPVFCCFRSLRNLLLSLRLLLAFCLFLHDLAADLQCFFCRVAFRVRESFLLESLLEALVHCVQFFL